MFRLAILVCLLFGAGHGQVDKTRTPKEVGAGVVDAVVDMISESCVFADDALFLRRIAYVATKDGEDTHTFQRNGVDYYGGIWQVDEAVFKETQQATIFFADIEIIFGINWEDVQWSDLQKPLHCGLASRIAIEDETDGYVPRDIVLQALIWAEHLQTISNDNWAMENHFNNMAGSLASNCDVRQADLMFVMDSSGSIGRVYFELTKEFVVSVVEHFTISDVGVRVAVITYSTNTVIEFDLEKYGTKNEIVQAIRNITYQGGGTNSSDALLTMKDVFNDQGRGKNGVPEIGIFMTDGQSNDRFATIRASDEVHATTVTVFSIGIKQNVNSDEVEKIGSDPDCVHVFYLAAFTDVSHFAEEIKGLACKAPAELIPGAQTVGEVPYGNYYHFKAAVSKAEGATVTVEMTEGAVEVFLSYKVRNPSADLHSHRFKVSSSDGVSSLYMPYNNQTAGTGVNGSSESAFRVKRSVDDSVELFGTLVGLGMGMKNKYTLTVVEGHEEIQADKNNDTKFGKAVSMIMSFFRALLLKYNKHQPDNEDPR